MKGKYLVSALNLVFINTMSCTSQSKDSMNFKNAREQTIGDSYVHLKTNTLQL